MNRHLQPSMRSIAVLAALLFIVAGCRTMTGRTAGEWIDDKQVTAKVKTAIATAKVGTLTRVDVDTHDGVVYLTGTVEDEQSLNDILRAARSVPEVRRVVSQLALAPATRTPPPASPRTDSAGATPTTAAPPPRTAMAPSPQQMASATPPITALKFSRMEAENAAGEQRFAAYDDRGQRVATLYVIPSSNFQQDAIANLDAGERRIDHVSIYPHAGSDGMQYHVVLWHVDRSEASRMQ